jgi:glutamate formiminotransferase / 5-formyltetrahydrofolate cyclo-ligase
MKSTDGSVLECVLNVSEGRNRQVIAEVAQKAGQFLLDVHTDPDHNRSVITVAGPPEDTRAAVREVARAAVALVDLAGHVGVHPRIGALDVVPWVTLVPGPGTLVPGPGTPLPGPGPGALDQPLIDGPIAASIAARDDFARWAGAELGLPCFLYGPERSLPELRREAWKTLAPDHGPASPHPTAGGAAVGARPALVAYNLWLAEADLATARQVAGQIRGPHIRALGLAVGEFVQVSCNLIAPWTAGPGAAFDAVASRTGIARAELVGLMPLGVLQAEPRHRWAELDLEYSRTIEARLEGAGLDGGRFRSHDG